MTDDLQKRTVRALAWSFVEAFAQRGIQFAIGIVLARLLFPEQFGLIGMLTIFIAVMRSFLDSGFAAALIQKKEVTDRELSSIFYFNVAVGVAAAGLLCLAAPAIAAFYRQPVLAPLTRALSAVIVINSFAMVQSALLIRRIDFKTQTKVSVAAGAVSGAAGIAMAVMGYGVWSLVVQQVSAALIATICLWLLSSWRPSPVFSMAALRSLFGYGSRLLASSVLNQLFDNLYLVVIGRVFSPADLGFFTRAKTLNELPSQTLAELTGRVTFPVFSSIQDDIDRVRRGLRKTLTALVMINFPVLIGLAVVAPLLVRLLLTDKWAPAVPYLQLLCAGSLLYPLHLMNLNVLQALGRSDLFLRLEIIKKALIVINIAVTWRWGISAMIWGMLATSVIGYVLNTWYTGKFVRYPLKDQATDLLPYLGASLAMGAAVLAIGRLQPGRGWPALLVQVGVGSLFYLALCRAFRLEAFMEAWQAAATRIRGLNTSCIRGRT